MTITALRRMTIKYLVVILFTIIVPIFFFPLFERTVVPSWRFQVVDETGHPMANVPVRQIWRYYSVEDNDHEEDSITDDNGFAEFPKRTIKISNFKIIKGVISKFLKYSIHASYGPSSYIIVLAGEDHINYGYYKKGWKLPGRVVVKPLHPTKEETKRK